MNTRWKIFGLSVVLSAPLLLGQIAVAQTLATPVPASQTIRYQGQVADQRELDAFFKSQYTYWDAKVLASFWEEDLTETKSRIGAKLLGPQESKLYLELVLTDAQAKALGQANDLSLYSESEFNYDDAATLAKFWGLGEPYDAKVRIERNLILGKEKLITHLLEAAR